MELEHNNSTLEPPGPHRPCKMVVGAIRVSSLLTCDRQIPGSESSSNSDARATSTTETNQRNIVAKAANTIGPNPNALLEGLRKGLTGPRLLVGKDGLFPSTAPGKALAQAAVSQGL